MKTIGFPISHKENEKRRTIVPKDVMKLSCPGAVYVEKGYGEVLGITDGEYLSAGCNVVERREVLKQDIICDPKIGDADYLEELDSQIIFGWVHATQNRDITEKIVKNKLTAYAWEKMFDRGRHIFWFNNELAGEAAVINAFQCYGMLPFGLKCAVLGNGNTARGAVRVLNMLGASVIQYNRHTEKLFRDELGEYDAVVNCVLWDVYRKDHIIYTTDLERMKKNALIIDVSCDHNGAIESSHPTSIEDPTFFVSGIMHYAVDHTPSIFYKTFSYENSELIVPFINQLMEDSENDVLINSKVIENGMIIDDEIIKYQSL